MDLRRERELSEAAGFQVGPVDLAGQRGALPQVTFGVGQGQGPCLNGPQVHQRHRPQVAVQRDVLVGLPGHRRAEEPDLFDDPRQVTAPSGQRQLQRRDRHPEPALAIRRRGPGVGLGDRQVRGRLVQAAADEIAPRAYQG